DDVEIADIARACIPLAIFRKIQIAEDSQPVVERDYYTIAAAAQFSPVVTRVLLAIAGDVASAMQPDHDRPLAVVVDACRPDIEPQAVFAGDSIITVDEKCQLVIALL